MVKKLGEVFILFISSVYTRLDMFIVTSVVRMRMNVHKFASAPVSPCSCTDRNCFVVDVISRFIPCKTDYDLIQSTFILFTYFALVCIFCCCCCCYFIFLCVEEFHLFRFRFAVYILHEAHVFRKRVSVKLHEGMNVETWTKECHALCLYVVSTRWVETLATLFRCVVVVVFIFFSFSRVVYLLVFVFFICFSALPQLIIICFRSSLQAFLFLKKSILWAINNTQT